MASLVMMSDRSNKWDTQFPSYETSYFTEKLGDMTHPNFLDALRGKSVLVLVHGFNNDQAIVEETYGAIHRRVRNIYDVVVGYLWPGSSYGRTCCAYSYAKRNLEVLHLRFRQRLDDISGVATALDVMGHSMGNLMLMKALSSRVAEAHAVRNFFSLAAAMDDEALERGGRYQVGIRNVQSLIVMYSERDRVLDALYPLVEGDFALGARGPEDFRNLPDRVRLVDVSPVVGNHREYRDVDEVYQFAIGVVQGTADHARFLRLERGGRITRGHFPPIQTRRNCCRCWGTILDCVRGAFNRTFVKAPDFGYQNL